MDKKMVPEVRFKGFTDDWELRKFLDIVTRVNNMSNSNNLPKLEYEDINSGYGTLNKDISKKFDNRKGILFEKNNILFGKLRPYLKKWYLSNFKGIALGDFWVLKTKGTNVNFVYYLIQSSSYQKVANNTSGTKMPRSDWKNVSQSPFYIPSIPEQSKVGNILKDVDLSITLQQRQLDLYKKLKKGLLQKLFPKDGERVPEVRFANFHDDWEQQQISEVAEIVGGGTPSTNIPEYWNGDINWYTPNEIGKKIFINHSKKRITEDGLNHSSAKILPAGTLLFTSRAGIGNTAILKSEGTTNQGFQSIIPKTNKLDTYFIYSQSNKLKRHGERVGGGSTFIEVSGKQLKKMLITIPKIKEQKSIGDFFQVVDKAIVIRQDKLKRLEFLKNYLLQKLFI